MPCLVHNFADGIDHEVGAIQLNVMSAIPGDGLGAFGRKMSEFFLHLLPGVIGGLDEIGGMVGLGGGWIMRKHGQGHVAERAGGGGLRGAFRN